MFNFVTASASIAWSQLVSEIKAAGAAGVVGLVCLPLAFFAPVIVVKLAFAFGG